jgi:hypothetical protein
MAKSQTRNRHGKDTPKGGSVHSERGVLLPVLTSGGVAIAELRKADKGQYTVEINSARDFLTPPPTKIPTEVARDIGRKNGAYAP